MICKKHFPEPLFNVHQCSRSGAKSYDCEICKKTFSHSTTLANHKRIHTGEKPYECEICKMVFSIKCNLTSHMRLHTGEKPYSCDICMKLYAQGKGLSRHNKTAAHIKRMKSKNTNLPLNQSSFVDCGESIKEEIKKEESVDDPLTIHHEIENRNVCENIKEEIKEEENVDDPLSIEGETTKSENIVIEERIDIVEHKIIY